MNEFTTMAQHAAEHIESTGYINPAAKGRTAQITALLTPVGQIKPALDSRYLVKGWIDRGAFSVVYGESNVGKTFLALDIAAYIAARVEWHGCRVSNDAGPVVYIAGEGGVGINNRIEALKKSKPELMDAASDRFLMLSTALDFCTSGDAQHLVEALAAHAKPSLIIVDTLARSIGNGDENTAKDMGAFVRNIDSLREATGAHLMVIHHSGKDTSKGARGSGSLRAAADTEIELTRDGLVIMAEARKQRDMPCGDVFAYSLTSVTIGKDEDGDWVESAVIQQTEAPAKKAARLKGQALIAMQAFGDALAAHGEVKTGQDFPPNRQCISLNQWREACDRHHLTDGGSDSAARTAFGRSWKGLQDREIIRVIDGYAWRCSDE